MKNILKNAENAEELLKLTSDTMILLDRNGICVDIAVYNVDLWFLKEDRLLGKNILRLLPPVTYRQVYPEFKKVLARREVSSRKLRAGHRRHHLLLQVHHAPLRRYGALPIP